MNSHDSSVAHQMAELPVVQKQRLTSWAHNAITRGWLSADALDELSSATDATSGQLFSQAQPPLVAGLFGGTGVGKSTLLNRLAGDTVARASAERPTSREITLYVHRSISVNQLPEHLPMRRMRTALHDNDHYQHVMFIDMPDFDSVEVANRALVDLWLPHLDVVMYVVSPERYRDDQGWKLLLTHAHTHAWLFIINQWDRGSSVLRDDFIGQLRAQGLTDPLVYCTDCADPDHAPGADVTLASDEFAALQQTLESLSDDNIISGLQENGVVARLQTLKTIGDQWLPALGDDAVFQALDGSWQKACSEAHDEINASLQWSMLQVAANHIDRTPFWRRLLGFGKQESATNPKNLEQLSSSLNERLLSLLERFFNHQAHVSGLPLAAMRLAVLVPYQQTLETSEQTIESALNQALLKPGKPWQQLIYRLTSWLCILLPIASLAWISMRVVAAFAAGGSNPGAYLGSQFAINSALLLGISWLLPALLNTVARPSREQAAMQGLMSGTNDVCHESQQQASQALIALAEQAGQLKDEYQHLWAELPGSNTSELPAPVRRMLSRELSQQHNQIPARELDVRANTQHSTDRAPLS